MKRLLCAALLLLASPVTRAAAPPALSPVVVNELKALDETYVVLDAVAEKVWPGWTSYRVTPFLFTFENGLRVLVGHPNPPKEFQVVDGLTVGGRTVTVDRTKETALPLDGPLVAGGGVIPYGQASDGTPVPIVNIRLKTYRPSTEKAVATSPADVNTEAKILVYLHELFHCFQSGRIEPRYGNLMYNADTDYAVWSNVEGLALVKAYAAKDPAEARERMKDFVVARALKRRSMDADQANEESADDVREGTATYAMVRALEAIKAGPFTPHLTTAEDPGYHGFANVDALLAEYPKRLEQSAALHDAPKTKCYDYGCFQALVCQRLFPGWQQAVEKGQSMDAFLAETLAATADERAAIARRLAIDYPVDRIRGEASKIFDARDAAYRLIGARKGRTYVVDFKPTQFFISTTDTGSKQRYSLGEIQLYPQGYPGLKLDEIELSAIAVPSATDQLYYVRVVDTDWKAHKRAYTVTGVKQADGTYLNAVVTTPLFTLKAPKVRITETPTRVKIHVLARVSEKKVT